MNFWMLCRDLCLFWIWLLFPICSCGYLSTSDPCWGLPISHLCTLVLVCDVGVYGIPHDIKLSAHMTGYLRYSWGNDNVGGTSYGVKLDCFTVLAWWTSAGTMMTRARFLTLASSQLRLCSANHRAGYFSNLACDWLSIVWAYSEQETEHGPWFGSSTSARAGLSMITHKH